MDLLNLGYEARKTGLRAREGLSRDKYDMEDLDEFFADTTWDEPQTLLHPHINYKSLKTELNTKAIDSSTQVNKKESQPKKTLGIARMKRTPESVHNNETSLNEDDEKLGNAKWMVKRKQKPPAANELKPEQSIDFLDDFDVETQSNEGLSKHLNEPIAYLFSANENGSKEPVEDDHYQASDIISQSKLALSMSLNSNAPVSSLNASMLNLGGNQRKQLSTTNDEYTISQEYPSANDFRDEVLIRPDVYSESDSLSDVDYRETQTANLGNERASINRFSQEEKNLVSLLPSPPPEGLRRSKRMRCKPLAYWRNERIIYSRSDDFADEYNNNTLLSDVHKIPLQEIKEVVKVPEPTPDKQTRKRKRKSGSHPNKTSNKLKNQDSGKYTEPEWFNDGKIEAQVFLDDEKLATECIAWAPDGGAFTKPVADPKSDLAEEFEVAPLFDSNSHDIAAGLLHLPPRGFKSLRSARDSTFIFYLAEGNLEVELNQSKFIVSKGCSFKVPRLNIYSLKNRASERARLFFVQYNSN